MFASLFRGSVDEAYARAEAKREFDRKYDAFVNAAWHTASVEEVFDQPSVDSLAPTELFPTPTMPEV